MSYSIVCAGEYIPDPLGRTRIHEIYTELSRRFELAVWGAMLWTPKLESMLDADCQTWIGDRRRRAWRRLNEHMKKGTAAECWRER